MAKLKFEIDTSINKLILGGYGAFYHVEDDEIEILKVLGIYNGGVEGFNIDAQEIVIIPEKDIKPVKLTIDGLDVAKESYRIFVSNIGKEYDYTVKTYTKKPKTDERATIVDMKLLNGSIFNKLSDRTVTIKGYNHDHHNYTALTSSNVEIYLRRSQFMIEDNTVDIATIKGINE